MSNKLFEGKGNIRKVKGKKDEEFFNNAKQLLGFKEEIDFVTFCVALALIKKYLGKKLPDNTYSLKEMAKMYSFKKADLYDLLIMEYVGKSENRLEEFEKYFCSGFKMLRDWFDNFGPDANWEIERFCEICDFLNEKNHSQN